MTESVQETVARIWAEALGVERCEPTDNVFDLGATSLMAERVVVRLRAEFHRRVPLRMLFESPTVAELASALSEG